MERELWTVLYRRACELDDLWKSGAYSPYDASAIVGVYLWAVIWDRPTVWACDPRNWGALTPPQPLPPQWTVSRRMRSARVAELWRRIEKEVQDACSAAVVWIMMVDGKPLTVSVHSKDREARWGKLNRFNWARGYKLHVIWGSSDYPLAWEVKGLNYSEVTMARELVGRVKQQGYLLADAFYDSSPLYDDAGAVGLQLLAPRRQPGGLGRCYQSPYRLRAIELMNQPFGRDLYAERDLVEHQFGRLTNFGGGLAPLPSWVRTLHRVKAWVGAKLLLNAVRPRLKAHAAIPAAA